MLQANTQALGSTRVRQQNGLIRHYRQPQHCFFGHARPSTEARPTTIRVHSNDNTQHDLCVSDPLQTLKAWEADPPQQGTINVGAEATRICAEVAANASKLSASDCFDLLVTAARVFCDTERLPPSAATPSSDDEAVLISVEAAASAAAAQAAVCSLAHTLLAKLESGMHSLSNAQLAELARALDACDFKPLAFLKLEEEVKQQQQTVSAAEVGSEGAAAIVVHPQQQELASSASSSESSESSSVGTTDQTSSTDLAGSTPVLASGFDGQAIFRTLLLNGRLGECGDGEEVLSVLLPLAAVNLVPSSETLKALGERASFLASQLSSVHTDAAIIKDAAAADQAADQVSVDQASVNNDSHTSSRAAPLHELCLALFVFSVLGHRPGQPVMSAVKACLSMEEMSAAHLTHALWALACVDVEEAVSEVVRIPEPVAAAEGSSNPQESVQQTDQPKPDTPPTPPKKRPTLLSDIAAANTTAVANSNNNNTSPTNSEVQQPNQPTPMTLINLTTIPPPRWLVQAHTTVADRLEHRSLQQEDRGAAHPPSSEAEHTHSSDSHSPPFAPYQLAFLLASFERIASNAVSATQSQQSQQQLSQQQPQVSFPVLSPSGDGMQGSGNGRSPWAPPVKLVDEMLESFRLMLPPLQLENTATSAAENDSSDRYQTATNSDTILIFASCARLGHVPSYAVTEDIIEGFCLQRLDTFTPKELATLAWSMATTHHQPSERLIKDLCTAALQALPSFTCDNLSTLVWSLAELKQESRSGWQGAGPEEEGSTVAESLASELRSLGSGKSVEQQQQEAGGEVDPIGQLLCALCTEAQPRLDEFAPRDLVSLLAALSRLKHPPPPAWLSDYLQSLKRHLAFLDGTACTTFLSSLLALNARIASPEWTQLFCRMLEPKMGSMDAPTLASLGSSVAQMGFQPDEQWADSFVEASKKASTSSQPGQVHVQLACAALELSGVLPSRQQILMLAASLSSADPEELVKMIGGPVAVLALATTLSKIATRGEMENLPPASWLNTYLTPAMRLSIKGIGLPGAALMAQAIGQLLKAQPELKQRAPALVDLSSHLREFFLFNK